MRRGDDMHGRRGTDGLWGAAPVAVVPCPDILVLVHRGRRSIRPKRASQFTPGAVQTTNQSQAPALARADAGEGLAAVTGGTALRASRHPHERASRQPWDRGECRRDQQAHRQHAYVEGIDSVA